MPKRIPCPECGSTSRHKSTCSKPPREAAPAAIAEKPKRAKLTVAHPAASDPLPDLGDFQLDSLLALRTALEAELRARREAAQQQAAQIADALGEAA